MWTKNSLNRHPLPQLTPQHHYRAPVQQAIRIPNHQQSRLPSPVRQYQSQPRGVSSNLEHWLTYHRAAPRHPRRQLHPLHSRRLLPSPPLPIHQIRPDQSLALSLFSRFVTFTDTRTSRRPSRIRNPGTSSTPVTVKHMSSKHCGSPNATTLCRCTNETPTRTTKYATHTPISHPTPRRTRSRSPRHSDTPTPSTPIPVHPTSPISNISVAFIPTPIASFTEVQQPSIYHRPSKPSQQTIAGQKTHSSKPPRK